MGTASPESLATALVEGGSELQRATIIATLSRIPVGVLRALVANGTRVVPLAPGQRYDEASPALKQMGIDLDNWPAPPAGIFMKSERVVYLRSLSAMTAAHELAHATDLLVGGGETYWSEADSRVRAAFAATREYVTPYASTGLDEYVAEGLRARWEVGDPASPWPPATRERLLRIDPTLNALLEEFERGLDAAPVAA